MTHAVFFQDVDVDCEKTSMHCSEEVAGEMGDGCEGEGEGHAAAAAQSPCDAAQQSTVASETTARQTKPKKLNKKQLLAEQHRKDRVCAEFSAALKCATHGPCVRHTDCVYSFQQSTSCPLSDSFCIIMIQLTKLTSNITQ